MCQWTNSSWSSRCRTAGERKRIFIRVWIRLSIKKAKEMNDRVLQRKTASREERLTRRARRKWMGGK